MRWNDKQTALLTKLWTKGVPVAKIAAQLGMVRNAIIGKAHRLKLLTHSNSCGRVVRNRHGAAKKKPIAQKSGPQIVWAKLQNASGSLPTMPDGSSIPAAQRRTLLQLTNSICKWPFGEPQSSDFFFCGGNAVEGKPYCASHCWVAYRG